MYMYVYSSPKECFVGGDFPRFGISQMFKFWYRLFFLGEVIALCNRPAALDAPVQIPTTITICTSVYISMLTDFIYYQRKKNLCFCLQTVRKRFELVR